MELENKEYLIPPMRALPARAVRPDTARAAAWHT